jgi:primosomal protein N' (replication factor Y)
MEEAASCFPSARLLRWDSDAARGKRAHDEIMAKMRRREADILIGTQMIAKGLDLPGVTLVGVVSADTALGLPDFRAGERTFQLLSQVAGRAGRGERPGRVIIQTYAPEHYAIQAVVNHDYAAFYKCEIGYRRQLANPPFSRLVRLTFSHLNEAACQRQTEALKKELLAEVASRGLVGITISGPAPAFIPRIRGRYRWQLFIKGQKPDELLRGMNLPSGWVVDVDPVGLS